MSLEWVQGGERWIEIAKKDRIDVCLNRTITKIRFSFELH